MAMTLRKAVRGTRRFLRQSVAALRGARPNISLPIEGIVFVVVTLLIGLAAMQTAAQLLFLVFSMMCSFWILSAVLATTTLRGLKIERVAPRIASAGQPARFRIRVRNTKRVAASYSLRIGDYLKDHTPAGSVFLVRVPPKEAVEQDYESVFPRRGIQRLSHLSVATRFPFGLIERTLFRPQPAELLVLPGVIELDEALLRRARTDLGEQENPRKGFGAGLYGLRDYRPGDPSRDIHWKVTARTGRLVLREYESEERRKATVLLDNRLPEGAGPDALEDFERAIILASSLLGFLIGRGHQVELLTASGKVAFGQGTPHLLRCRRALALLELEVPSSPAPHAHIADADSVQFEVLHNGQSPASADVIALETREYAAELSVALAGYPANAALDPPSISISAGAKAA